MPLVAAQKQRLLRADLIGRCSTAKFLLKTDLGNAIHTGEHMRNYLVLLVVCLVGYSSLTSFASAQTIAKALSRSGLIQEDVDIMTNAAAELYQSGNAVVGADTIWSNPETNAYGMAEITETAGNCVRIAQSFRTKKRPQTQTLVVRRCLVDGRWILSD